MAEPTSAPRDVVQALRFELVDRDGRVRGAFGELHNPDASALPIIGLTLYDTSGCPRAFLSLDDTGPSLAFDSGGNNVMQLGVNDDTTDAAKVGPYAFTASVTGTPVVGVRVSPEGQATFIRESAA